MVKLNFHADPSHAWLAVPRAELARVGVADKISDYSYQKGSLVYLEEDADAGIFLDALKLTDNLADTDIEVTHYENENTPIRRYQRYTPDFSMCNSCGQQTS